MSAESSVSKAKESPWPLASGAACLFARPQGADSGNLSRREEKRGWQRRAWRGQRSSFRSRHQWSGWKSPSWRWLLCCVQSSPTHTHTHCLRAPLLQVRAASQANQTWSADLIMANFSTLWEAEWGGFFAFPLRQVWNSVWEHSADVLLQIHKPDPPSPPPPPPPSLCFPVNIAFTVHCYSQTPQRQAQLAKASN